MKVWASASAIGLSMAYFATACSSEPPDDNGYQGTAGTPGAGGTPGAAGTPGSGGTPSTAGSTTTGGTPGAGGTPGTAGAGGNGTAGNGTSGSGGAPPGGACPEGVLGHCKAGFEYPVVPGFKLALVEEFDAPLDLNTDPIWTWSDGNPADGQTGFREEGIDFEGGYMTLTADKPAGCTAAQNNCIDPRDSFGEAQAPGVKGSIGPMGVWSGELRSRYNNYRYGRYEVKLQPPNQPMGNFLSTMFIFRTPKNVVWNEIDIEIEPWKENNRVWTNAVNFTGPGGPVGYPNDPARNDAYDALIDGFDKYGEHVYAFNWTPEKIEWFVNGALFHTFTGEPANLISTKSAKIMMNLWIFGGSGAFGDPTKNTYPMVAKYDWFRFYKLDSAAEPTYPCSPTPGCLPAEDKTTSSQNNPKEMNYGQ